MKRKLTLREHIRCREVWTDGRTHVAVATINGTDFRWVGRNQHRGSGKLVGFTSALSGNIVHTHTLPTGPGSRCLSFRLATFLRRFKPTGRFYKGKW
jgi:hypothetical protein